MTKTMSLALLMVLSACGGRPVEPIPAPPIVVPQPVAVAVDAPCVPDTLQPPPVYVDRDEALRAAADAAERYQLIWAGRSQRVARLGEIEPVLAGCPRGRSR